MEELKLYKKHYDVDAEEIAQALVNLAEIPAEYTPALDDAIFFLQTIAQNNYNSDFFRILFNTLVIIAERRPEA